MHENEMPVPDAVHTPFVLVERFRPSPSQLPPAPVQDATVDEPHLAEPETDPVPNWTLTVIVVPGVHSNVHVPADETLQESNMMALAVGVQGPAMATDTPNSATREIGANLFIPGLPGFTIFSIMRVRLATKGRHEHLSVP